MCGRDLTLCAGKACRSTPRARRESTGTPCQSSETVAGARITIYPDGGGRPNPGPGGWGAVLESPEGRRELSGSDPSSTNNRMELTAAIRALEAVPPGTEVDLVTDSTYLQQGVTQWLA